MDLRFGKIFFFIVFVLWAPPLLSQVVTPKYIDSLYEVAYQQDLDGNIKEAQAVANRCTELSNKINYKKGLLQAEKIHVDCKMLLGVVEEEVLALYRKIAERAKKEGFNDVAAVALFEMATFSLYGAKDNVNTLSLLNEAVLLNCGKDSLRLLGDIYNVKAIYCYDFTNVALGVKYLLIAYNIFIKLKDEYRISKVSENLSHLLYENGLYSAADFYASQNLVLAVKMNSPTKIYTALFVKIDLCRIREQWDSVKYYVAQEAITGKKIPNDDIIRDNIILHRAMLYDYDNKSDSVLICLNGLEDSEWYFRTNIVPMYVLNYLQLGREGEAKIKLDRYSDWVKEKKIESGDSPAQFAAEYKVALLTFAYNLYKETKTNSWIPAFKKHILSLPEKTLLLQGQNKVAEIFGFDESFAKADYLVAQAEVKAQEVVIKLKEKRMAYLVTFFIVAVVLLALLLFFFTKIRRLMAQEGRTNEQLAQNNSYLQMYDRAIGHDLASPLALINDCAQTLRDGKNDEAFRQQLLDGIYEHSVLALRQVRGLLRLGISSDSAQQVALSTQLLPLVQESQRLAGVFGNPVRVQGAEDLPLVLMNADALKQIFQNLFSNSLKHSGRGKAVEIEVKGEYKPKSKFCTITISDNGSGINSSASASIFDLGTTSTTTPSTGLGLAICKVLMDKFGGSIEYQDGQGAGSSFVLKVKVV